MDAAVAWVSFAGWIAVLAQEPRPGGPPAEGGRAVQQRAVPGTDATELERRIDAALLQLRRTVEEPPAPGELATAGSSGREEPPSFEELRSLLRQSAAAEPIAAGVQVPARAETSRLERAVDALERRSFEGPLAVAHVDMLHEQVIDARIDAALDAIGRKVSAGEEVDATEVATLRERIERRVQVAASFDPQASELNATMQSPLAMLRDRAAAGLLTPDDLRGFRRVLTDARIEHAISTIESRSRARDLGLAEIQRLRDVVDEHVARAPDPESASREYAGLIEAIDQLDEGLREGTLEPGRGYALRRALERSAREASYEKPKDGERPRRD